MDDSKSEIFFDKWIQFIDGKNRNNTSMSNEKYKELLDSKTARAWQGKKGK